jgi:hypothetical protein
MLMSDTETYKTHRSMLTSAAQGLKNMRVFVMQLLGLSYSWHLSEQKKINYAMLEERATP